MMLGASLTQKGTRFSGTPLDFYQTRKLHPGTFVSAQAGLTRRTGGIYLWTQTVLSALLKHKWLFPVGDD